MDGQPWRRGRLAHEARELDAANAVRADLLRRDAAPRELLCKKVTGLAQAAAGDELALSVGARSRGHAQLGLGAPNRGDGEQQRDGGEDRARHWRILPKPGRNAASRTRGTW